MMVAAALGFLVLGLLMGFLCFRELSNWAHQSRTENGECAACGAKAHVSRCARCKRHFAMCHQYGILGTDDPRPKLLRVRRGAVICSGCVTPEEQRGLDSILG